MNVTLTPSKNSSAVGQGVGTKVGVVLGDGVGVGDSSVAVFVGLTGVSVGVIRIGVRVDDVDTAVEGSSIILVSTVI